MRALLLIVLAVPLSAQIPAASAFQQQKAEALLRGQLSCLGCHELNGEGGRIAPSLTEIGARRTAAYIRAIVEDPQRVVRGAAMPKVPMSAGTRETIVRYLSRGASNGPAPALQPPVRAVSPNGANLYGRWCAACHGHNGSGDGPNSQFLPVKPAVHSSATQMSARSDDAMFDAIAGGGAVMGKSPRMPPFGATLSPAEIRALVAHIRSLCSCSGPAWSRPSAR